MHDCHRELLVQKSKVMMTSTAQLSVSRDVLYYCFCFSIPEPNKPRCALKNKQTKKAGRSNQSILKEISPEYSLEGLMLKLKLQHFDHLMQRTDSLEKTLKLGKIEGRRRRGQQRMR